MPDSNPNPANGAHKFPPRTGAELSTRLDHYYKLIKKVLLSRQDPVTGLLPASTAVNAHGDYTDAWVRDNVYSILGVWGLGLAYRKLDWNQGRTYELQQSVVKTMRGLLVSMMRQVHKVERFKETLSPLDALHAKYDTRTGSVVVGDAEWGHLQIDATSIFVLMLAEMTASGLSILYTIDEVNFVQNLIYYIGRAYRIPDYGIWERGNKINRGDPELNASSIGMSKAALEAMNSLNLFGVYGGQASVAHVLSDEIARARITLESLLPWESSSKEVDSALLTIVGYPAFAVENEKLANRTRKRVIDLLQGDYGCKRFLRDGHQTTVEDVKRLHYESWELKQFENIECEWPLFYVYLMLDGIFRKDKAAVDDYRTRLEGVLVERDGMQFLPELYFVPDNLINAERANPHSQQRTANANVPLVWAQSLYYLALMLDEGLLEPGEIDPLNRHIHVGSQRDPVVQVILLAEDEALQAELVALGVSTQTPQQIEPIEVRRAAELSGAYQQIGRNDGLGLTGRPIRRLRSLTTSKFFLIRGQIMLFLPSFLDPQKFYLMHDREFLVDQIKAEVSYIHRHWRQPGRPTITLLLTRSLLETGRQALLNLIEQMKLGECDGVHIKIGRADELKQMSGIERIDYLHDFEFEEAPVGDALPKDYLLRANSLMSSEIAQADELAIEQETNPGILISRLSRSTNLLEMVVILQALTKLGGLPMPVTLDDGVNTTVEDLLEDVYIQATRGVQGRAEWSVVRRAGALLDKTDVSLSDAVTDILVRQKQITVGKSYSDASVISRPLPPADIREMIRQFGGADVRDWMLTQEIIIYLGLLIKSEPERFVGLLTLRAGYLILLMTSELAADLRIRQEDAHEYLMQLCPSEIQLRLRSVLCEYDDAASLINAQESLPLQQGVVVPLDAVGVESDDDLEPPGGWTRYRQREGTLNRVPKGFYPRVWSLLKHCHGLIIGDKLDIRNRIESETILSEMTPREKNFALWVEHLLNKMDAAKFRQANIEALLALSSLVERSPSLKIDDYLVIDVIIGHAVRLSWLDDHPDRAENYSDDRSSAWQRYYEKSPKVCEQYIVGALQFLTQTSDR